MVELDVSAALFRQIKIICAYTIEKLNVYVICLLSVLCLFSALIQSTISPLFKLVSLVLSLLLISLLEETYHSIDDDERRHIMYPKSRFIFLLLFMWVSSMGMF